ncbi:MAG: bifunctional phosphoribosyl-AMP cyclohydrolase/phosphoribosyl-ATP diphosphatase HisIE [Myxococcales bacterium]|nr:bifunctional phosphoribosyl-AMP cyclohydrolase/phosphoribosyl-ATP diphosphatase HisIE [Myxococcales bacterium]
MDAKTLDSLKWDDAGLVTVVALDRHVGEVRMVAHATREALARTLESGTAWFWSRSRAALWQKGESSGNVLRVSEVWADCDGDALVYLVEAEGPTCHTGAETCFFRRLDAEAADDDRARPSLARLGATITARAQSDAGKSYTKSLLDGGAAKIGEKLREEAGELADALAEESDARVLSEAADLLFHALVGLELRGLGLEQVAAELARRFGTSGHVEKASRPS